MNLDEFQLAEQHYTSLTKLGVDNEEDLLNYAYSLKANQKYDAAVVVYERYLKTKSSQWLLLVSKVVSQKTEVRLKDGYPKGYPSPKSRVPRLASYCLIRRSTCT